MGSWKEDIEYNYSVLDKIDILPYLKPGAELLDIMDQLESDYESLAEDDPKLKGYLFNLINDEEFMEYLKIRYPRLYFHTWEVVYHEIGGFSDGA